MSKNKNNSTLLKLKVFWNLNNANQTKLTNVLNYKQWTKLNYLRWALWMVPMTIIGLILSLVLYFVLPQDLELISYFAWLLPVVLGVLLVLFGLRGQGFITYLHLKHNERYPKSIENGSSFFLQDVRWPWKEDTDWYNNAIQRYYHLPEADWIITSNRVKINDYHKRKYLNELSHIFKFDVKESIYDKDTILGLWNLLKRLSSVNEVMSATMSFTDKKLNVSKKEFLSMVSNWMVANEKTHPLVEIEHLPKMPNALNSTPSGGGKTTAVVYPHIISNATASIQGNMFITDPKGELMDNCGNWLKIMGYDVYSFNLKNLHLSQGWNPVADVYEDVVIRGYLSQILASYQKHNLPEYDQLSIIYNKDINIVDVLTVEQMIEKVKKDSEYRKDMFKVYTSYDEEMKSETKNSKCYIHKETLYKDCSCNKNKDLYIDYGNRIYAGLDNIKLLYITILPALVSTKVYQIINALMNPDGQKSGGDNAFWDENAKNLFQSAIWVMLERKELNVFNKDISKDNLNLFSLYRFTIDRNNFNPNTFGLDYKTGEGQGAKTIEGWLSKLGNSEKEQYLKLYQTTRNSYTFGGKVIALPDKTRTIVEGVVAQHLVSVLNEGAKYATSFPELDFNKIVKSNKPYAIFMGIDPQDPTYHKLGILFISMLYQKLIWWAEQQKDLKLPRPFMFVLDEAGNLPAIPNLDKILSLSRSYRVMMLFVIQSMEQLKKSYKESVGTILDNTEYKIIRGAKDFETAKKWSDTIGNMSIKKANENYNKQRALITPDEIMDLDSTQRHQTLFFATVFNPDGKKAYSDSKKKPKWFEVSQAAGAYKFIQKQTPWYQTYNTKLFNALGAIPVKAKQYTEKDRIVDYDKLHFNEAPNFSPIDEVREINIEEDENDFNNYMKYIPTSDELDDVIDDGEQVKNPFYDDEDDKEDLDPEEYVDIFQEDKQIVSQQEAQELDAETLIGYTNMTFNEFARHYTDTDDENEIHRNIVITDRDEETLRRDLIKLMKSEYQMLAEVNIEKLLDKFSSNISMKRFNLLVKQLIEINNIFIDQAEFLGTNHQKNVEYINNMINKVVVWLLYGKNDFTISNMFDSQINEYVSTKPDVRNIKLSSKSRGVNELIELIKDYLKSPEGEEFRKQFILDYTNKYETEESWEEMWKNNWKDMTKYFDDDWIKYLYGLVFR